MPTAVPGRNPPFDESGFVPPTTRYNGIRIPTGWPPTTVQLLGPNGLNIGTAPLPCPYIDSPPNPIIVRTAAGVGGRQLWVDDFLIESMSPGVQRVWHQPTERGVILAPDKAWEVSSGLPNDTYAMMFSDGNWWDAGAGVYKIHYYGGRNNTCYAESATGEPGSYTKPDLGGGTNICMDWSAYPTGRDSATLWLDLNDPDPAKRWKMAATTLNPGDSFWHQDLHYSADGKTWGPRIAVSGQIVDRTTFHWDPFLGMWVWSIRDFQNTIGLWRYRRRWEQAVWGTGFWPALNNPENSRAKPVMWYRAQLPDDIQRYDMVTTARDVINGGTPLIGFTPPQTYNIDGCAYESVMVYGISQLDANFSYPGRPKGNWVRLGFSRDSFHMSHPSPRRPFIDLSQTPQNARWGNVQTANPVVHVDQDKLRFLVSGRSGVVGEVLDSGVCSTLMFDMRRDGFCSLEFPAGVESQVTTRRVRFDSGTRFYVNARANAGYLKAEIIDGFGAPIPGFTKADSATIASDTTWTQLGWTGDISTLVGRVVRFRFYGDGIGSYAFGITDNSGNAGGFVHQGRA